MECNNYSRKCHKDKRAQREIIREDKQMRYFEMERHQNDPRVKERFFRPAYKPWSNNDIFLE